MRWNYTKTLLILAVGASVVRYLAAIATGSDPWAENAAGGGAVAGLIYLILLGPFFVLADVVGSLKERRAARNRAASA